MADQDEVVFRHRICRGCNAVFSICRSCDRGQCYCSSGCRLPALREQRRRANRRHQASIEGRLDHRDRQRAYRKRCAQRRVTDTSSPALTSPGNISAWHPGSATTSLHAALTAFSQGFAALPIHRSQQPNQQPSLFRCVVCGRPGRFVDPFPPCHASLQAGRTSDISQVRFSVGRNNLCLPRGRRLQRW